MTTTPTASPQLPDLDKMLAACRVALVSLAHAAEKHGIYQTDYERFSAAVEEFAARRAQPEGEAPQAEPVRMSTDESREYLVKFMEKNFTDKTYHRYIRGEHPYPIAGDFAWQMARALRMLERAPAATLSPLCGAQHAESGKELTHCDPAEGFCKACREQERAAQLDGGQEGSGS